MSNLQYTQIYVIGYARIGQIQALNDISKSSSTCDVFFFRWPKFLSIYNIT